jgi:hypothetical protein
MFRKPRSEPRCQPSLNHQNLTTSASSAILVPTGHEYLEVVILQRGLLAVATLPLGRHIHNFTKHIDAIESV